MIIVSATAEELKIIRDALIHAGARRKTYGLNPDMHRRLAETFNAALSEGEVVTAVTSTLASGGHSRGSDPQQWLSTREIAKRLGCSTRQARRIAQKIGRQIGTDWFVSEESL
jgi:hypothetical protein